MTIDKIIKRPYIHIDSKGIKERIISIRHISLTAAGTQAGKIHPFYKKMYDTLELEMIYRN
jgi:hypothetical protein